MELKQILRVVGILVSALLGFGCVLLLVRWLQRRREEEQMAVPAFEIDITTSTLVPEKPDLEEEGAVGHRETAAPVLEAGSAALQGEALQIQQAAREGGEGSVSNGPDDLGRIRGIGPKIASVMMDAGITTFAQLAASEADQLRQILGDANPRLLQLADPTSWPRQAELAAAGDWEALDVLQGTL